MSKHAGYVGSMALALLVLGLLIANAAHAGSERAHDGFVLYVDGQAGNDAWSGTLAVPNASKNDGPFATLDRARDAIRKLRQDGPLPAGGVGVKVTGDIYLDGPFELMGIDSGTSDAPIRYVGTSKNAKPRIIGGKQIRDFHPVTDAQVLGRLKESARAHVVVTDLKANGITDLGQLGTVGNITTGTLSSLEIFFNGARMTLARWPNVGWAKTVVSKDTKSIGSFGYEGEEPGAWLDTGDIWLHGYWTYDWYDIYLRVTHIDAASRTFTTSEPQREFLSGKRYFALNVLEELDMPGEYCVDRANGLLYFWPPSDLADGEAIVSTFAGPLIALTDTSHVTFSNLSVQCGRGIGITTTNVRGIAINTCEVFNVAGYGISIKGVESTVSDCDIHDTGEGGIDVVAGDRKTLSPCNVRIVNNHIHDYSKQMFTYRAGVRMLECVGVVVANNLIENAPHSAIYFGGNDNVIERNEIRYVLRDTSDAGAIYTGLDWTACGTVVRHNYIHDLGNKDTPDFDANAVYFDDYSGGMQIVGNVCVRAGRAVLLGGGRSNLVAHNIFIDCTPAVHLDARGLGWSSGWIANPKSSSYTIMHNLNADQPPYTLRYPHLATILTDELAVPKYNVAEYNVFFGGRWLDLREKATDKELTVRDNWTEGDPGFIDPVKGNFKLKANSPLRKVLWFQTPDMRAIGLQRK